MKPTRIADSGNRALPNVSEAHLKAILDTTVDAIIMIDERGVVQSFNHAAEKIFGYTADEVVGRNVSMLMPSPHQEMHDQYLSNYLSTGKAKIIGIGREERGLRKDGTAFPLDLAVSEVFVGEKRIFTGIVRDITERKHLEQAVVRASEVERDQIGQELHDALGQQLTGLTLMAKALEKKLSQGDMQFADDASAIAETGTRNRGGDKKRLAQGLYPTQLEKHGLNSALIEFAESYQRTFDIACTFDGYADLADFDRETALHLYRIAQEAANNAKRHGHATQIDISLRQSNETMILAIEDNGSGISHEAKKSGGGMGLAIMKYRAMMIGGTVEIKRRDSARHVPSAARSRCDMKSGTTRNASLSWMIIRLSAGASRY